MTIDPIAPLTVVRLVKITDAEPAWKEKEQKHLGRESRIGFYSKQDGLDCVWLVDGEGRYAEAVDQEMIRTHFQILMLSDESDLFGERRPVIGDENSSHSAAELMNCSVSPPSPPPHPNA